MTDEVFTDTEDARGEWVDVRMTNPDEGQWDIDAVVVDGQVEYVDLRVRPDLLAEFVGCLIDDIGEDRADRILRNVAGSDGPDT